ncbi:hypothetical protein PP1_001995 [Pseudonocardia sp. P1]|nr:hypothetical protein Ae707Ps1_2867c [Pseudonocardia sp. Ae707_Ps1]
MTRWHRHVSVDTSVWIEPPSEGFAAYARNAGDLTGLEAAVTVVPIDWRASSRRVATTALRPEAEPASGLR